MKNLKEALSSYKNIIKNDYEISTNQITYLKDNLVGNDTAISALKEYYKLSAKSQKDIYGIINNSYVVLPKKIENKNCLLVHGTVSPSQSKLFNTLKFKDRGLYMYELGQDNDTMKWLVEKRNTSENCKLVKEKYGYITICGHSPENGKVIGSEKNGFYKIDAGCGYKSKNAKLALFSLDDFSVYKYIDPKNNNIN